MKRIKLWLRAILRPSSLEDDLREEFLHHLDMEVLKNIQNGLPEAEARRKAMVDFGGVERFMEQTREVRATRRLENWWGDFRHAIRGLLKAPAFSTVTVLTLAIGIGANTAIFSVVSGVLLKPLPFPDSHDLVFINSYFHPESGYDFPDYPVGSPEYFDYRSQNRALESVAAVSTELVTLTEGEGDPEVIPAGWVSPSFFVVLGTPPLLGRTLLESDGGAEPARVVVLSYDLWQNRFGGDAEVVGRGIDLGMEVSPEPVTAEIVGVMPEGFAYPRKDTQLWGSLPLDPARTWRGGHWFDMIGRLGPGSTLESAQAEMAGLMSQWAVTYPDHHIGHGLQMRSLMEEEVGSARPILLLLLGAVGIVLLIACANVTSLLLAKGEERRREVAVRSALGASRSRILQHGMIESFVLAALGGILGLMLALVGVKGLVALEAGAIPRVEEIGLDLRVLGFTGLVVLLTTCLAGLLPALREASQTSADSLREAGIRITAGGSTARFRRGLVVGEIAFGVLLVVGAGLLIRSFQKLLAEDPGFPTENLFFSSFSLPAADYSPEEAVVFFDQLLEGARALPGVRNATLMNRPPLLWSDQSGRFHIEGREAAPSGPLCCLADPISVGRDFFETIGISAVSGRLFQAQDHTIESESVAIVDEAAVSRWWPDQDPLGQRIRMGSEEADWMTVVGVVENVTFDAPGEYWPHVYTPHNPSARTHPFVTLATFLTVRAEGADAPVSSQIRSLTRTLDPGLAVANEFSMETILSRAAARSRFVMSVLSVFALVAVVLGAIGIYGVISYSVALRVREIGIRRALGAGGGAVVLMVLRQGMVLAFAGVGLGLAGAFAGTRLLEGFLHDVEATDPFTYALVGLGTLLVASAATYLPARGAGGVDPLEALRIE